MTTNNTYNGWYNYATWRLHLEIFDGMEIEEAWDWEQCRDYAEEIITMDCEETSLAANYAMAFINDVAWVEIAEHLNEQFIGE